MTSPEQPAEDAIASIAWVPPRDPTVANGPDYEPMGQVIARQIRAAIIDGRLPPGSRIRQEALASRFGTSRIPVREALNQLENEGLVVLIPHSGARVARLEMSELMEVYRMREALEPLAIRESAPRLSDEQLERLHHLADVIAGSADNPQLWLESDRLFHLGTYEAADMPRVLSMVEGFWNTTQQYRRAYLSTLDSHRLDVVTYEHRLILDALDRHDPDDAASLLRSHIHRTRMTLTEHAELFSGDA